jgi:hypothetical protein
MPHYVAVDEEGEPGILAGTRRNRVASLCCSIA